MGIMDVLEQLSGAEYDDPAVREEVPPEAAEQPPEESAQEEEAVIPEGLTELLPQQEPSGYADAPEPETGPRKRVSLRPELILCIVAALAGILLGVLVLVCLPFFSPDEDPEALSQRHEVQWATEPPEPEFLEPTEEPVMDPALLPDPNPYDRLDFQYNKNNYLVLQNVESYPGVDVSAYQGDIDWKTVKASGIEFAIIRLGYRGYESGKLVEDEYARKNLEEASAAGLKIGAYFFSQALSKKEADEELLFMLDILEDYYLDMPLVLDWEIPNANARTARMDARTLTDIQLHFCAKARELGYEPMVYFNWHQGDNLYHLKELEAYPFWLALYQDRMTYPWRVEMWQYTNSGQVPGIPGPVDINVYMPI